MDRCQKQAVFIDREQEVYPVSGSLSIEQSDTPHIPFCLAAAGSPAFFHFLIHLLQESAEVARLIFPALFYEVNERLYSGQAGVPEFSGSGLQASLRRRPERPRSVPCAREPRFLRKEG